MIDGYGAFGRMKIGRGNRSTRKKKQPQCKFIHHRIPNLGSNPARCVGKPANNRLSYGTSLKYLVNLRNKIAKPFYVSVLRAKYKNETHNEEVVGVFPHV
jgi:hypothetical protein